MSMELLFQSRKKVGNNLLYFIKDNVYTKASFSKLTNISRPTLNRLIKGEIDNLTTFKTHLQKIFDKQIISEDQLLNYTPEYQEKDGTKIALSDNAPDDHLHNPRSKKLFNILDDIVHLYDLYQT